VNEDETRTPEGAEDFMTEETGGSALEQEKTERTRESEIQANIEFWKELGIEVDEADVRKEVELIPDVKGFEYVIFIPKGLNYKQLLGLTAYEAAKDNPKLNFDFPNYFTPNQPRKNDEAPYAVALNFDSVRVQNDMSEGKYDEKNTNQGFLSLPESLVLILRSIKEEKPVFPDRPWNRRVGICTADSTDQYCHIGLYYNISQLEPPYKISRISTGTGRFSAMGAADSALRVVGKDTPDEILEEYRQEAAKTKE